MLRLKLSEGKKRGRPKLKAGEKGRYNLSAKEKARKKSYYARHNAQDAKPDIFSARYWSHKVKW